MNIPLLRRRRPQVVNRNACINLAEMAADASLLLGIKWEVSSACKVKEVGELLENLAEARDKRAVFALPRDIDFFPQVRFEIPGVKSSCLFLLILERSLRFSRDIDVANTISLDAIKDVARVDVTIFSDLFDNLSEAGEPAHWV